MTTRAETPTSRRVWLDLRKVCQELVALLKEVPLPGGQPEQLGKLADGNDQCQAEDKAGDHRLGEEVRDEAQADDTGQEQDRTHGQGESRR